MSQEHFLVTGAMGCIGAWVVRCLVKAGTAVTALDASTDDHRLRLVLTDEERAQVKQVRGDITDLNAVEGVVKDHGITQLVHLAALQVPFCKADPSLGARVNVVGTVNLFEAARRAGIKRVVYASSIAVFGQSEDYPTELVQEDAAQRPHSLYGVYTQANEGTAQVYWWDYGISSVGLRPYIVYGPGRDQGMTSGATWAMLAAAAGRAYRIPYGGKCGLNYVEDVARIFIQSARIPLEGAEIFNLRGSIAEMGEVLAAIQQAAPEAAGLINFAPNQLAFPVGMDDRRLRSRMPELADTPLNEGVAATVAFFRQALQDGRVKPEQIPA